jgi:hypothetical protein
MRPFMFIIGIVLSNPSMAGEGEPPVVPQEAPSDSAESLPAEAPPVMNTPADPVREETPYWDFDYQQGVRTSRTGMRLGTVGLVGVLAGVGILIAGVSTNNMNIGDPVHLSGIALAVVGGGVAMVGGPVAALGVTQSHRALVQGGQADRGCGTCVVAVILSIPNPMELLTLPLSYAMTSAQRNANVIRYHRYKGWSSPSVRISPSGAGLSWKF